MIDVQHKKRQIISFLEMSGPSLPVRIARAIDMDPVFASAILSELLNSKQVKMSSLRVGASSLYLIPGTEQKLEEHTDNLKSVEKDTYLKLKENKILVDDNEEPAIRVALRNIKDFAIPFNFQEKIVWRYAFTPAEEIQKLLNPQKEEVRPIEKREESKEESVPKAWEKTISKEVSTKKHSEVQDKEKKKMETIFEEDKKTKTAYKENPQKKNSILEEGSKPEFLNEVKNFLKEKKIEFLEEVKTDKKEIVAKAKIKSTIGELRFLIVAKNKFSTNKDEISSALQLSKYHLMPCIFIIRKEPSNAIRKIIEGNHLINLEIMD